MSEELNIEECRKAFEEWAKSERIFLGERNGDGYCPATANVAWRGWKELWNRRQEAKPLTEEQMLEKFYETIAPLTAASMEENWGASICKGVSAIHSALPPDQSARIAALEETNRIAALRIAELEAEVEKFKANNRYQRGYHDGQLSERARIKAGQS